MARERFDHKEIEAAQQKQWEEANLYVTDLSDTSKEPYYLLFEFPYPSGDLHIGHWYAFALTDIFARFKRAEGRQVLFPIGFDAFGLPAENAAIKHGVDPADWTYKNMDRMRTQIRSMGTSVDWTKEVVTCDPEYYKWTQWLFAKLFEQGLAERRNAAVKWCPKDQTVLANEQVSDGKCERCGTEVEEKHLTQWFLKITDYAKRLLTDLDPLPWREEIKDAQRAWIGESEGAKLSFALTESEDVIDVFTTRADTVFGATYVVLAPEHPLVDTLKSRITNTDAVDAYRKLTGQKTERERSENKEKTGVQLEGVMAINPATKEQIPVYIADYVLASYGTGAVMAVPAHDERDFEFAQKLGLPMTIVVTGGAEGVCYGGDGEIVNSGEFTGRNNREALKDIVAFAGGELTTNYRLRDWLVSRQRYWGCPIPVVYDPEGNPHLIPAEHLPWKLPTDVDFAPNGSSPLSSSQELKDRVTRIFGEGWTPEYDTLDTFVDSSWYYLRYLAPHEEHAFSDSGLLKRWLPVNRYSGGSEHTTMHLLYARFFHKALFDMALVPTPEPFYERFNRGLIMGTDGQKMSKSKGNVVNPDEFVQKYGSDAVRMYLAFIGPYNEPGSYPWNLDGVEAMRRFLDRIYNLRERVCYDEGFSSTPDIQNAIRRAVEKVTLDTERFKMNTAISALMILVKELESWSSIAPNDYRNLLILLAPYAPHLSDYLWGISGGEGSVHQSAWLNAADFQNIENADVIAVQVNGKRRGEITLHKGATETDALLAARAIPAIEAALGYMPPARTIYVPGRILNLVAASQE